MDDIEGRLNALEARVHQLEDQVQLYQIMSAYGPLVDSGDAKATAALWTEDGLYDWGGGSASQPGSGVKEGAQGAAHSRAEIADMVRGDYHQAIIKGGAGHVIGLPHIAVDGDKAVAISYSRLYRRDGDNFRVWRVGANRWEFVRTADGWRVKRRINRVLTGEEEPRALLRSGFSPS
jgi:hypothetical protein